MSCCDWYGCNTAELIKIIISGLSLVALFFGVRQIKLTKKNLALTSFKSIYDDHFEVRKLFQKAASEREALIRILDNYDPTSHDITEVYGSSDFDALRKLGYHYEYIGILVKEGLVSFPLVYELILFPDKFWEASQILIEKMRRKHYPDFWKNFEHLRKYYLKERKRRA